MRLSVLLLLGFSSLALNAQTPPPPTAADAQAFLDRAGAELRKASVDGSHAEWLAETDINEDSEATGALLVEQGSALQLKLIEESHRFDHLTLPPAQRRQLMLLQVNAPAAPHDPKLLAESSTVAAQLTGMYGKGKYCPGATPGQPVPEGTKCLSIDEISSILAKSRDPEEMKRLWIGWHAIGAPMRSELRPLHRAPEHRRARTGLQGHRRSLACRLRHDARPVLRRARPRLDPA